MRLKEIADLLVTSRLAGDGETEITGISNDSRTIEPGQIFICLRGHTLRRRLPQRVQQR
jgi:UDP-N-acetylmuramoyl-L-alanyl-D-glutamate--2,6-diaminopimelate ligase